MDRIYLDPEIYYLKNILSEKHLKIVQNFAKDNHGWYYNSEVKMKKIDGLVYKIFLKMYNDFILPIEPNLNITLSEVIFSSTKKENKPEEGVELLDWQMPPHADYDANNHNTAKIKKGLVYYLNDDFSGGEIVYVNKNIIHKPIANSLIVHPSSEEYAHGVKLVTNGNRYTLTGFYKG